MFKKRMLDNHTRRYESLPAWFTILIACGMVVLFFLLGQLVGGATFGLLLMPVVFLKPEMASTLLGSIYFQLGLFSFVALSQFAWVKWYEKRSITSLGFFKQGWFLEILKGWGVGMGIFTFAFALTYLFGGVRLQSVDFSWSTVIYVLSIIPFWFVQGGTEELLTRGWLLPIINKRSNLAVAIGISSSLFGFMHLSNSHVTVFSIMGIILSGVFMALYMLKTDNLWGVAGLHGAWNFTQGNIFGVAVSGTGAGKSLFHFVNKAGAADWVSGGRFGTEGSLLTSLVLLVASIILALLLYKEKEVVKD
ncbi:CPBP family intramembrane glutamic endopeptidase [Streptococcus sp. FT1-106]|uniref:CPBP family intramembrane glutamic endopeptidase n=1 Tax=unclassified Streptococcus TaxID=2608887 RepID=UPI003BF545F8